MATSSGTASGVGSFVPAPEEGSEDASGAARVYELADGDYVLAGVSARQLGNGALKVGVSNGPAVRVLSETGSCADGDMETVIVCGGTVVRFGDDVVDNYSDIATRFERSAAEHSAIAQWASHNC